ncbi:hypothetical protein D9757_003112 [Collybiopsis confluens]|uniref:Uncharacterized protein n=1 Tax=Collybiopsis confluens TaxID=2823264 RepID=A0A8H5HXB4_9AGAR|nr:hypothetical protein D9757_003112 [Collybiopsis confluens]
MARTQSRTVTNLPRHCRLYDSSTGKDLVLDGASASVVIADVHASVSLSQQFNNPTDLTLSAVFSFGVMADAAVYGFEMIRQDGTKVEGVVKGKEEAERQYARAVREGHTASLGQVETSDVFSISVGNLLPSETVTINLRYLQPLTDDEKQDQIKFIFPRTYAQRYGSAPTTNTAQVATAHQPFQMDVVIQQVGPIKSISCPSGHPVFLELGRSDDVAAPDETSHFATVSLTDRTGYLTQDVVLVITAAGLDAPRCFVEPHTSPNHETTALALTFVPRFNLPDVSGGMEYIFLVDRSGSMGGQNIQLVREALVVLLRGLPTLETTFNIFSFGSKATKLWEASRAYSQDTLEEATNHVDNMQADYGGTEIASALQLVFSSLSRPLLRPVAVFLLTDGAAWDVATCTSHTETALATLPASNDVSSFIRVFTVGIGNGASSRTCDSIARAGHGISIYVKQGEPVVGKCARLVRAARTPPINDLTILWTSGELQETFGESEGEFEMLDHPEKEAPTAKETVAATISLFDDGLSVTGNEDHSIGPPPTPDPTLPLPPVIQQTPLVVPSLFPGTRAQIYAIVNTNTKADSLPPSIKVKGVVATTGTSVELVVPVSRLLPSPTPAGDSSPPFLHTFAAKGLITDRQDGKHAFPRAVVESFERDLGLKEAYLKKEIIRLGTTYTLATKHTSFIAVDHRDRDADANSVAWAIPIAGVSKFSGSTSRAPKMRMARRSTGGKAREKLWLLIRLRLASHESDEDCSIDVDDADISTPVVTPWEIQASADTGSPPLNRKRKVDLAHTHSSAALRNAKIPSSSSTTSDRDPLTSIARLQQFNGSLSLSSDLLVLLGIHNTSNEIGEKLAAVGVANDVGATVLAWEWMERSGGDETLNLIEKAKEWVKSKIMVEETTLEALKQKVLDAIKVGLRG